MTRRKAVGIDLGTTFCAISHIDVYGKPQIIPNSESERITPSVILFDGASVIVGTLAKNNSVAEAEKIVDFVKREMGKPKEQFQREFNGKIYSAEELSALILRKLKADAEKYLKEPVTDAVHVTGRFDYQLRVACRDTAELDRLLRHLKRDSGVSETDTRVVLRSAFTRGAP